MGYKPRKSQEIGITFTIIDSLTFDKRCSGANFVSFLFYYHFKTSKTFVNLNEYWFQQTKELKFSILVQKYHPDKINQRRANKSN